MLLEQSLEKYPLHLKLRDGTPVCLRPLARRDAGRLQKFLMAVPEPERLFIKPSLAGLHTVREWCRHPDFDTNLPLLMLHGTRLIGEATLHQRRGGWKRHIGLITLLTHPDYRGRDVSTLLVQELIELARGCGLRRLEAEINGERRIALAALARLGFHQVLHLPDYVLDLQAVSHDYLLLGLNLKVDEEFAGVGD